MVPLKYISNFGELLKFFQLIVKINYILTWTNICMLSNNTTTFAITDPKHYVLVPNSSTQDNAKLLMQLKSIN